MEIVATYPDRWFDMTDQEINALVAHGISAFNAGDHDRAYALFVQALQTNPQHEVGWLWMSAVVREAAERRYCLEQVLAINPQHQAAQRGLTKFPGDLPSRSPLPPQPAAPVTAPAAPVSAPAAPVNAPAAPVSAPAVPVSAPAVPVSTTCTHPGCTEPVTRAGHTFCYTHWKQTKRPKSDSRQNTAPRMDIWCVQKQRC